MYIPEIEIQELALPLEEGQSRSVTCPFCSGGASGKDKGTMSISRVGGLILYNCFRVSCAEKGVISDGVAHKVEAKERDITVSPEYDENKLKRTNKHDLARLCHKYDLNKELLEFQRIKTVPREGYLQIYMPLRGCSGKIIGYNIKSLGGKVKHNYFTDEGGARTRLAYPFRMIQDNLSAFYNNCPTLVVVEDIYSALRLTPYVHAVALNGTNLNDAGLMELVKRTNYIKLALDPDTWVAPKNGQVPKIIQIRNKIVSFFKRVRLGHVKKDIKDLSSTEFNEFINQVRFEQKEDESRAGKY